MLKQFSPMDLEGEGERLTPTVEASGPSSFVSPKRLRVFVIIAVIIAAVIVAIAVGAYFGASAWNAKRSVETHPNVIFMIGDGLGNPTTSLTRSVAEVLNRPNPLDIMTSQGFRMSIVATRSSDSEITDSAAGATAYACAKRTYNGGIGVDPSGIPCGTLLEAARLRGYKVGLVVTKSLTDATPAGFSAHTASRNDHSKIAAQQIESKIDVMIGGGRQYFDPLLDRARALGYTVGLSWGDVTAAAAKGSANALPLLAVLATNEMPYAIDAANRTGTVAFARPSLTAMANVALSLLPQPYFVMIEGSKIDIAGHANDVGAIAAETIDFYDAVAAVINTAAANTDRRTVIVVTADHDTGGLGLAPSGTDPFSPLVVSKAAASAIEIGAALVQRGAIDSDVNMWLGTNISATAIASARAASSADAAGSIIAAAFSSRAGVTWTTTDHTASDVPAYTLSVSGVVNPVPTLPISAKNIDVGSWVATVAGLDLNAATTDLQTKNLTALLENIDPRIVWPAAQGDPYHNRY